MDIREYVKTLDQKNSYWLIGEGDAAVRLNDTEVRADNLYFLAECWSCATEDQEEATVHAYPLSEIQKDRDGDYVVCCQEEKSDLIAWLYKDEIPEELEELFNSTEFDTYKDPDEDEDEEDCDYDEEYGDADEEDDCDVDDYDSEEEEAD